MLKKMKYCTHILYIELKPKENFNDDHVDYTKFTKELHQMFSSKQKLY